MRRGGGGGGGIYQAAVHGSCNENYTHWHFTVRTLSKCNRFRMRKLQNASWGYVILKFSRSKTIVF